MYKLNGNERQAASETNNSKGKAEGQKINKCEASESGNGINQF